MSRPRIFVIDSDAVARAALEELLGDAGYEVVSSPDAAAALPSIERAPPDLVLAEDTERAHATRELRTRLAALDPAPRLVFISADPRRSAFHGCAVLEKPIDVDRLLDLACELTCATPCHGTTGVRERCHGVAR